MESIENFKKRLNSSIDKAYSGNVSLLPFLDEGMEGILLEEIKFHNYINVYSDGGFINSDRKRYILSVNELTNISYNIIIFKIKYNKKYYNINHRSILGSLMSLGIKRECIGDIVITNDLDCYFAVTKEMSTYIKNEFHSVGKAVIELEEIDYKVENIIRYDTKLHFLSSLRLDVVIAGAFKLSRSEALEMITSGLVYVNQILNQNSSFNIKLNDVISVRHKGKIKILSIDGLTRSERIKVEIGVRI